MDEVIKNTHSFVDILCMARGEAVQRWDEDTFHRAFKWAQYFEQVLKPSSFKLSASQTIVVFTYSLNLQIQHVIADLF